MPSIDKFALPCLYSETYTDKVGRFLLVFQPLSTKGMTLLNPEAAFLYKLIDSNRNLGEIYKLAKKEDSSFDFESLQVVITKFIRQDVVYVGHPGSNTHIFPAPSNKLTVWFHLTNNCNLRCPYCYVYKSPESMSEATMRLAIKKLMVSANKHGYKELSIKFAGGEPLLEKELLFTAVKIANKAAAINGLKMNYAVLTNGVLLTKELCRRLRKERIAVSLSLDGLGNYHDETRFFEGGKGSFHTVERGIKNLQREGVRIGVTVTITNRNIENLPDLAEYLLKNKIHFIYNLYRENPLVTQALEVSGEKLVKYLKKVFERIEKDLPDYSLLDNFLDRVNLGQPHLYPCAAGSTYFVVDHKGNLSLCPVIMGEKIGSLESGDLVGLMKKRGFPGGLSVDDKKDCADCRWRYGCAGGCPLLTRNSMGGYSAPSPYCPVYQELIPLVLRLEAKRIIKQVEQGKAGVTRSEL